MRPGLQTIALVAGTMTLVCANLHAIAGDRYQAIVERNVFRLVEPPPKEEAPLPIPEPPVTVKYTGYTVIAGQKRAHFVVPGATPKDPPQYLSIPEGDTQGNITVVRIMDKSGDVQIRNVGATMTLNFTDHGIASVAMPAQMAAQPGRGATPAVPGTQPGRQPQTTAQAQAQARALAQAQAQAQQRSGNINAGQASGTATGSRAVPTRTLRLPAGGTGNTTQQARPPSAPVDPAVQRIMMEASVMEMEQRGIPAPPLPPMPGVR